MEIVCISLSGNIIAGDSGIKVPFVKKLEKMLKKYRSRYKFIITVGGGYSLRLYIKSTRSAVANNSLLDQIGIAFTRINALILRDLLSDLDVYPNVVTSLEELKMAITTNDVAIMGGLIPGVSTDAVCALACETMNCKMLINVSNLAYVYDRPPSENGSKKLDTLTHDRLLEIAFKYDNRIAGSNFIFDMFASKIAKRANLRIKFVSDNINDLEAAIQGRPFNGSIVK
ncbi:MAG: UMP kinase [Candidatus Marsarchaeota archaeon]|jgi:uridylate kinase|nr:UMP kinase [Candidatus Marsarchaeota archaeon]